MSREILEKRKVNCSPVGTDAIELIPSWSREKRGKAVVFPVILSMEQSPIGHVTLEIRIIYDVRRNQEQHDASAMYDGTDELKFQGISTVVISRKPRNLVYTKKKKNYCQKKRKGTFVNTCS